MGSAAEALFQLQNIYKQGVRDDYNFNSMAMGFINASLMDIAKHNDYWFLQAEGSLTTVAGQWEYDLGGIAAPSHGPQNNGTTSGFAPALTDGPYWWIATYVDSNGVESSAGPRSNILQGDFTDDYVSLFNLPISPSASVVARRLYRNRAEDADAFYRLAEIPNNTQTTYTDTWGDAALLNTIVHPRLLYLPYAKPFDYAYQVHTPLCIRRVGTFDFRQVIPRPAHNGPPEFVIIFGRKIYLYPTPDAAYVVNYPYHYYPPKLQSGYDGFPEEIPVHYLVTGAERHLARVFNKELKYVDMVERKFAVYLAELDEENLRQEPMIRVVGEDEDVQHRFEDWPPTNYLTVYP